MAAPTDTEIHSPGYGAGRHPNSLANLAAGRVPPMQLGEASRNPLGRNQYTYRDETEALFAERCKKRMGKTLDALFDAAEGERGSAELKLILERAMPAVAKLEHALAGTDPDELAAAIVAARRRTRRGDGVIPVDTKPSSEGNSE